MRKKVTRIKSFLNFQFKNVNLTLMTINTNKKIEKTIQSLYDHNKKMEKMRKYSIDSFTDRDNFSE